MLMRFDPFRDFDRLTQQLWGGSQPTMPIDVLRTDDAFVVHFDLPGVDPSSIDLTIEKNVLTVSAERAWGGENGVKVLTSERPQGRFRRQLFLGEGVDGDNVEANYEHGVLTVRLPVAEHAWPRKVAITSGRAKALAAA